MRVLGGRDYYDGAGWGVDTSLVFARSPEHTPWEGHHPLVLSRPEWRHETPYTLTYGRAMAGAEILPFVELRSPAPGFGPTQGYRWDPYNAAWGDNAWRMATRFVYDPKEARAALEEMYGAKRAQRPDWGAGKQAARSPMERMDAHFAKRTLSPEELDWAMAHRVAVFVHRILGHGEKGKPAGTLWVNAANLGEVEAWKALEPATAHMRISSWLGGVLPVSKPMVELTNAARVAKAGFDARSFRKDPQPTRRAQQERA